MNEELPGNASGDGSTSSMPIVIGDDEPTGDEPTCEEVLTLCW